MRLILPILAYSKTLQTLQMLGTRESTHTFIKNRIVLGSTGKCNSLEIAPPLKSDKSEARTYEAMLIVLAYINILATSNAPCQ